MEGHVKPLVRLGCWAAFWGDTAHAARQLLTVSDLDYLVSDYLAEITMALLARARVKDPAAGFVPDAVDVLAPLLETIEQRRIRVVTNAGGLNPLACAAALREAAATAGVSLRVASVQGDDMLGRRDEVLARRSADMFTGRPVPREVSSLNAYLGATPIAAALDAGADIVVCGRCVDSAVVLGPLMHEFGWTPEDYDRLSAGTLVGHIVECGPQCTGGLHTDWFAVPGWADMGYPVAECRPDGSAVITKPPGTGGLVSPATVAEQIVYEIGDPGAYVMPDVICDWREVSLAPDGEDRVTVTGARGRAPTGCYKATATHSDGYRALTTAMFAGQDATGRARRVGEALIERTARLIHEAGHPPVRESLVEVIGAGDTVAEAWAPQREAVVKIGVRHSERAALEIFARELAPMGLVAQGMTGIFAGRPRVSPVFDVHHLLIDKSAVTVTVDFGGEEAIAVAVAAQGGEAVLRSPELDGVSEPAMLPGGLTVALRRIAYARSGDKGDSANVGVIARRPEFDAVIRAQVTADRVAGVFAHYLAGEVHRWELPGLHGINFVLDAVLGGSGGTSTLRYDPQGKSYAAMLLTIPVQVAPEWESSGLLGPDGPPTADQERPA